MKICLAHIGSFAWGKNRRKRHITLDGKTPICNDRLEVDHIYPRGSIMSTTEGSDFCKNCLFISEEIGIPE